MFCTFFMLNQNTDLKLIDHPEQCNSECEFYDSTPCSISKRCNIKLTNERFGWTIDTKVDLKNPVSNKSGSTHHRWMIKLVHPLHSDMWILKSHKKDMESVRYIIYANNKNYNYESFVELNVEMKKLSYNGRKLTDDDFVMENLG